MSKHTKIIAVIAVAAVAIGSALLAPVAVQTKRSVMLDQIRTDKAAFIAGETKAGCAWFREMAD